MSADDTPEGNDDEPDDEREEIDIEIGEHVSDEDDDSEIEDVDDELGDDGSPREELTKRLSEETDRAVEGFDQGLVDLLSWMLDTETRARIYVYLRQNAHSTSEEIAEGTGLYPSTVREALAELHDEEIVDRRKRENEGAGNNPYEYAAIAPSDLVGSVADQVQNELNTVFNLDRYLGSEVDEDVETESEPVTITVEDDVDEDEEETADDDSEDVDAGKDGAEVDDLDEAGADDFDETGVDDLDEAGADADEDDEE